MAVEFIDSRVGDTGYGQYDIGVWDVDGDEVEVHIIPSEIWAPGFPPEPEEEPSPGEVEVDVIWDGALDFYGSPEDAIKRYPELAEAGAFE